MAPPMPAHRPAPSPRADRSHPGGPRTGRARRGRSHIRGGPGRPGPLGATSTTSSVRRAAHLAVMDREAMGDEQRVARRQGSARCRRHRRRVRHVGRQQGDEARASSPPRPAIPPGSRPPSPCARRRRRRARRPPPEAAVAQIAGVGTALAAIADHRDRRALQRARRRRRHWCRCVPLGSPSRKRKPPLRVGSGGLGFRSCFDL